MYEEPYPVPAGVAVDPWTGAPLPDALGRTLLIVVALLLALAAAPQGGADA